ncbi:hypothetical protein V5O48_012125 [Marasmius crinis-equi]|uniref:Uncharacterized protein n=1 Tax=Marasmius crinis-equi TaxID=585013 RepID=A0ABR3F3P6_9AGAR
MAPLARRATDSSPDVGLIVAAVIGGIAVVACIIAAVVIIRRRQRRRPQPVRPVSVDEFSLDVEKTEDFQQLHNPFETDAHPTKRMSITPVRPLTVRISGADSPSMADFDTTALLHEHHQYPHAHGSPHSSPSFSSFSNPDGPETRMRPRSISPKYLPRLVIPNSPKPDANPVSRQQPTLDSAVEATLIAPGVSQRPLPLLAPQRLAAQSASPSLPQIPPPPPPPPARAVLPEPAADDDVESDYSASDTESAYSQFSASTRQQREFFRDEAPPPPVPPLPEYLRQPQIPITIPGPTEINAEQAEEEEELDEEGNPIKRAPTILIANLLKKRARRSGEPTRQSSRVSRIERSDSIVSFRTEDDETPAGSRRPSRRSTKRRRGLGNGSGGQSDLRQAMTPVWEGGSEAGSPVARRPLPNPFESAISPSVSPSTTRPPTPGSEHLVPSYQAEVSKSLSVTSEKVQPLRIAKRSSLSVLS